MNTAVFFDLDGTICKDVHYCRQPEDFVLMKDAGRVIRSLNSRFIKVIIITNQSGIGRGYFSEEDLEDIHNKMKKDLERENAFVDGIYFCPHRPDDNCACRKPKTLLVKQAVSDFNINITKSYMVGDSITDIELGNNIGCKTILISRALSNDEMVCPDFKVKNIADILDIIL
jgi:histidinol-phosphate phosphatase family protein